MDCKRALGDVIATTTLEDCCLNTAGLAFNDSATGQCTPCIGMYITVIDFTICMNYMFVHLIFSLWFLRRLIHWNRAGTKSCGAGWLAERCCTSWSKLAIQRD